MTKPLTAAERFFYQHAGFSHAPNQTPEDGKRECVMQLAEAEAAAKRARVTFTWSHDPDTDSLDFCDDAPPWKLWQCMAYKGGECVGSLGGVDFGRDRAPYEDSYSRVVEAEIALEAMKEGAFNPPATAPAPFTAEIYAQLLEALAEWAEDPIYCMASNGSAAPQGKCDCWACIRTRKAVQLVSLAKGEISKG